MRVMRSPELITAVSYDQVSLRLRLEFKTDGERRQSAAEARMLGPTLSISPPELRLLIAARSSFGFRAITTESLALSTDC